MNPFLASALILFSVAFRPASSAAGAEILFARNTAAPHAGTGAAAADLSKAEALADLDAFAKRLREEAAYIGLHHARPFEAIETLKSRLPDRVSVAEFTRELQRILSPIGDCHSSVSSKALEDEPGLWLPFRLAPAQGGIVAVTRDNTSFVEPGFPYLVAIDGQPLQAWLDAALQYEPVGSPTQNLYASLKGIRRQTLKQSKFNHAFAQHHALKKHPEIIPGTGCQPAHACRSLFIGRRCAHRHRLAPRTVRGRRAGG